MAQIAVLDPAVADQIAAGEVVERPASAVKELIENALDAGACTIDVEVRDGGRDLIRVSDDGSGMDRIDCAASVLRHATSKIRVASDIVGVASYGFRGEALPAIASVSRLELVSTVADGEATTVELEGGGAPVVSSSARRRGTTVTVRQLFYNTPARRKFLRSARSEWRAIADTIVTMALTRPAVAFHVTSDGREALSLPPARSLRERMAAIWGPESIGRFIDVDGVSGPIRVSGVVERPADAGQSSRRVLCMINGRAVRDSGVARAVEAAYRSTLPGGVRPSFLLSIVLPADAVDVNVHPSKAEVRFHDRWGTERTIERIVQRALGTTDSVPWLERVPAGYLADGTRATDDGRLESLPLSASPAGGLFAATPSTVAVEETEPELAVPPLLQLRRTYILYEHEDGVVMIDQHSAHERVLYERFLETFESGSAESQRLLMPETLHVSPDELEAWEATSPLLMRIGYEVETFGGMTLVVHAVPVPHSRFDALRCLRESLAALGGHRNASEHAGHEKLAATVACKAAIRAGDLMSGAEMGALFRALAATKLPAHDVHGRSTIVRLSWDELDRRFGRR
ncbi:MAG: DNA mismatch repair endonuclease MutL [Gemmatimonadota bacterium]